MYKISIDLEKILLKRLYRSSIKKNKKLSAEVLLLVKWAENIDEAITAIKNNIETKPLCPICSKALKLRNIKGEFKYPKGCSIAHAQKASNLEKYGVENVFELDSVKNKIKKTNIEKYGVEHPMKSSKYRNKVKKNIIKIYGVDNVFKSDEIKHKIKESLLDKYGVEHPMYSNTIKNKLRNTCIEKYGVDNVFKSEEIKDKIKKTNIKKYGVAYHNQSTLGKEMRRKGCIRKYGVSHPMKYAPIFIKNQKASFKRKEYKWSTGEISYVQGYEPIILNELENKGYMFKDVLTSPSDMPEIYYDYDGKKHRYYPDIFIPKENKIIEVKSNYTLNNELDRNQAKFNATIKLGYNFQLEIR